MILTKKQLEKSLRLIASLQSKAMIENNKIIQHCIDVYGVEPADVDKDQFIDSCSAGCGEQKMRHDRKAEQLTIVLVCILGMLILIILSR